MSLEFFFILLELTLDFCERPVDGKIHVMGQHPGVEQAVVLRERNFGHMAGPLDVQRDMGVCRFDEIFREPLDFILNMFLQHPG